MKQARKVDTMFEATTNARTRDAIRNAHMQRGEMLRQFFRRK